MPMEMIGDIMEIFIFEEAKMISESNLNFQHILLNWKVNLKKNKKKKKIKFDPIFEFYLRKF